MSRSCCGGKGQFINCAAIVNIMAGELSLFGCHTHTRCVSQNKQFLNTLVGFRDGIIALTYHWVSNLFIN